MCINEELDCTARFADFIEGRKRNIDQVADTLNVNNDLVGLFTKKLAGKAGNHEGMRLDWLQWSVCRLPSRVGGNSNAGQLQLNVVNHADNCHIDGRERFPH